MSAGHEIYNEGHLSGAGFTAAAALAAGTFVKPASNATINVAGGATGGHAWGCLKKDVASGAIPEIITDGEALALLGDTVTIHQELMSNAAGALIPTTAAGDIVSALALDTGVVTNRIRVQLVNYVRHA